MGWRNASLCTVASGAAEVSPRIPVHDADTESVITDGTGPFWGKTVDPELAEDSDEQDNNDDGVRSTCCSMNCCRQGC